MSFGTGLRYQEKKALIPVGKHVAKIAEIVETQRLGKNCLEVKLEYDDFKEMSPNIFRLFDIDPKESQKFQEWNERKISRFCDASGAYLNDIGLVYTHTIGVKVIAEVVKKDNGYTDISQLLPITETAGRANAERSRQMSEQPQKTLY